ncbi:SMI1/KNR4 family protein [Sphingobium xenophagum]|uniref:Knr4/Smi1-like domain-containing protein n=1 Tax=Sphingobium xenophagum TaxID=121428 RepID=A0A401J1B9_SPHXE|nr:SMI1/KNR4 family protein [Sphingobium xenophagum]GBH30412.1 hypothetical protein MBESOW_P1666 [Sphingobium xenophagum]
MSLLRFVEKWTNPDYPPERVLAADLRKAEQLLVFKFPSDYEREVLDVGLPQPTIALLDAIVERELDVASVGDFYAPEEIVSETTIWKDIGMPDHLIAVAGDESGNKFCFSTSQIDADRQGVWFFDHDFGTVEEIASSFSAWIEALCNVEPWIEE